METLAHLRMEQVEPLPFGSLGTRRKRVTLDAAHTLSGSAAFVSLSSASDQPVPSGAPAWPAMPAGCGSGLVAQLVRARA